MLVLASLVVSFTAAAALRLNTSDVTRRLRRYALGFWATGLISTFAAMLAARGLAPDAFIQSPAILTAINGAAAAGGFLMLTALCLTLVLILTALWRRVYRHP